MDKNSHITTAETPIAPFDADEPMLSDLSEAADSATTELPNESAELPNEDDDTDEEEGNALYEHFRIVADKGQDLLRVDKFLMNLLPNVSRNRIQNAAKATA